MTDKELLELAAKAADLNYDPTKEGDEIGRVYSEHLGLWVWHWKDWWNPLTDDGDALWLAVKLGIDVLVVPNGNTTTFADSMKNEPRFQENHDQDPYAATRRAIVRAAAAIGEGMK
jgi:hypothetical protein